jgi:hypothetical protein
MPAAARGFRPRAGLFRRFVQAVAQGRVGQHLLQGRLHGLADGDPDRFLDGVGDGLVEGLGQPVQDPIKSV